MNRHMETNKINHELLLKTVKNLKQKSDQSEEKLKVKDAEIEQFKKSNAKKDEKLSELNQNMSHLITKYEKQNKKSNQKIEQLKKNVDLLETFAERAGLILHTQSTLMLYRDYQDSLFQEDYDNNKAAVEWKKMVEDQKIADSCKYLPTLKILFQEDCNEQEETEESVEECQYLNKLNHSIENFGQAFYRSTYKRRFESLCWVTPMGTFDGEFTRIGCSKVTKSICVTFIDGLINVNEEYGEVQTKVCNDVDVCSYYDDIDCLHIHICHTGGEIYLLHASSEDQKMKLINGEKMEIEDIEDFMFWSSIFIHIP